MATVQRTEGWAEAFLFELSHGEGLASTSMVVVERELTAWFRWLSTRGRNWLMTTACDIRAWLAELLETLSHKTIEKKAWVNRRLYGWAHREGMVATNPWAGIARPRKSHPWSPRFTPTVEHIQSLMAQPDTGTAIGIRDRAILELLYATGLRASELVGVDSYQISSGRSERSIKVMGKGNKERLVLYGEVADLWLRYYEQWARRDLLEGLDGSSAYFVHHGSRLSYWVLQRQVRAYADRAGQPLTTAHSLRHAFATHLYEGGANLRAIQLLLGHSNMQTTCAYAKPSKRHLLALLERHHPRGNAYQDVPPQRGWRDHGHLRGDACNDVHGSNQQHLAAAS